MQRIRKNDQVMVITGRDRGKIGRVTVVYPERDRILVEKVNVVKRHVKPTQKNPKGGIIEKEVSIHISNVMPVDQKSGKATRVGFRMEKGGKKIRFGKKTNESLEPKQK